MHVLLLLVLITIPDRLTVVANLLAGDAVTGFT
jgi:hypothetical protein